MEAVTRREADLAPAREVLARFPGATRADLIPLLQEIQEAYGYVPRPIIMWMSDQTGIPASHMYGVLSFYAQFHTKPYGTHTIRLCRGTACHVKGANPLIEAVKEMLDVEEGETTADGLFSFETVACLGTCFLSPVMMIDNSYYGELTIKKIKSIIEGYARASCEQSSGEVSHDS